MAKSCKLIGQAQSDSAMCMQKLASRHLRVSVAQLSVLQAATSSQQME
jgi:hypothetical protein